MLTSWVKPGAIAICLGQHGHTRIWSQDEINQAMLQYARQGNCVVRLKGGDPAIFARGAEEMEFLERHTVPYEIVPGITAALAAGSHAGIPLTHRDYASAVAFVTGHEDPQRAKERLDYAALARFPGTLVIYMGVTTAATWVRELIEHGMSSTTPAALVRRCSFPDQQVVRCTLQQIPEQLTPYSKFPPPVVAIIGAAVGHAITPSCSVSKPLIGQTVLLTRPQHQAQAIARQLTRLGAGVLYQPAIEIGPPRDWTPVDEACRHLSEFDWIVFSSANGVEYFLQRLWEIGYDLRALAGRRLAAIGPATSECLRRFSLRVDLQPLSFRAESLAAELASTAPTARFLLVRASRGRESLADTLRSTGGCVTQIIAYESRDLMTADPAIRAALKKGLVHWTMVSSSAIARSLHRLCGKDCLAHTRLVSISPVTSDVLRQLGYTVALEASSYTMEGMITAILEHGLSAHAANSST
jgi:uroporphyrinogen III methyltransferase/synthase